MDAGTTTTFVVVPAMFAPEGCAVCEVAVFGARSPTGTCGEESVRTWIAPPLAPASPPASRSFAAFCGVRDAEVFFRFRALPPLRPPPLLKAKEVFAAAEDDTTLPRGGCDAIWPQYDESPAGRCVWVNLDSYRNPGYRKRCVWGFDFFPSVPQHGPMAVLLTLILTLKPSSVFSGALFYWGPDLLCPLVSSAGFFSFFHSPL